MSADITPTAFISYSHEDKEFVRALRDDLERRGVRVWMDEAELLVGDSLVQKIGEAIKDNDFVIGIISPASATSAWCAKELSIATTDGINSRRVKVLPVCLDGAKAPHYLSDTVRIDADRESPERVAAELAIAMERGLGFMPTEVQQSISATDVPSSREASAIGAWSGVRWTVTGGPRPAGSRGRDATGFAWDIERGDDDRTVIVWISRDAQLSSTLPVEVVNAIRTRGRSVVERIVTTDSPPSEVLVATYGIRLGASD